MISTKDAELQQKNDGLSGIKKVQKWIRENIESVTDAELQQKNDVLSGIKKMLPVMFGYPASGNEWDIRENVDCNGNAVKSDGISSVGVFCNGRFICSASVNGDSPACLAFDTMRCIERAVDII